MTKKSIILMGILIFIIIAFLCIFFKTGKIEQDLQNRSEAILENENIAVDSLRFSGRDANLMVSTDEMEQAKKVVANLYGVRAVKARAKQSVQKIALPHPNSKTAPRIEPTDSGVVGIQKEVNRILSTKQIEFASNSATLTPKSRLVLDQIIKTLQPGPNISIEISGHTDSTGEEPHNLILSKRRAQTVADYLKKNGLENIRFTAVGYGSSKQIADNSTSTGRQKNRRIEFKIKENN